MASTKLVRTISEDVRRFEVKDWTANVSQILSFDRLVLTGAFTVYYLPYWFKDLLSRKSSENASVEA